jgi:hypothetical protein
VSCWVIYDARDAALHGLWFAALGVPIFAFGWLFWRKRLRRGLFAMALAVFVSATAVVIGIADYLSVRQALTSGHCSFVDGDVQDLQPMRDGVYDKRPQSFNVAGLHFVPADPLPVSNGKHVHIWHRDGRILRLETCFP